MIRERVGKAIITAIAFLVLGAGAALGQTRTPVINHRQAHQQARIRQGVRSGQLTRRETRRLEGQEHRIRAQKRAYKSTGHVTPAERRHLRHELNRTSRHIYRQKHDAQTRNR